MVLLRCIIGLFPRGLGSKVIPWNRRRVAATFEARSVAAGVVETKFVREEIVIAGEGVNKKTVAPT